MPSQSSGFVVVSDTPRAAAARQFENYLTGLEGVSGEHNGGTLVLNVVLSVPCAIEKNELLPLLYRADDQQYQAWCDHFETVFAALPDRERISTIRKVPYSEPGALANLVAALNQLAQNLKGQKGIDVKVRFTIADTLQRHNYAEYLEFLAEFLRSPGFDRADIPRLAMRFALQNGEKFKQQLMRELSLAANSFEYSIRGWQSLLGSGNEELGGRVQQQAEEAAVARLTQPRPEARTSAAEVFSTVNSVVGNTVTDLQKKYELLHSKQRDTLADRYGATPAAGKPFDSRDVAATPGSARLFSSLQQHTLAYLTEDAVGVGQLQAENQDKTPNQECYLLYLWGPKSKSVQVFRAIPHLAADYDRLGLGAVFPAVLREQSGAPRVLMVDITPVVKSGRPATKDTKDTKPVIGAHSLVLPLRGGLAAPTTPTTMREIAQLDSIQLAVLRLVRDATKRKDEESRASLAGFLQLLVNDDEHSSTVKGCLSGVMFHLATQTDSDSIEGLRLLSSVFMTVQESAVSQGARHSEEAATSSQLRSAAAAAGDAPPLAPARLAIQFGDHGRGPLQISLLHPRAPDTVVTGRAPFLSHRRKGSQSSDEGESLQPKQPVVAEELPLNGVSGHQIRPRSRSAVHGASRPSTLLWTREGLKKQQSASVRGPRPPLSAKLRGQSHSVSPPEQRGDAHAAPPPPSLIPGGLRPR